MYGRMDLDSPRRVCLRQSRPDAPNPGRIVQNVGVASGGKRAGSRRAPRRRPSLRPSLLALALGVTLAVVAWGYLVYAAIDFGSAARGGDARAWGYLGVAALGAVACLFVGLMLIARLLRRLGLTKDPSAPEVPRPRSASASESMSGGGRGAGPGAGSGTGSGTGSRPAGGRRAAR